VERDMKKLRILAVETHYKLPNGERRTSAVDWWRIINPFSELQKHTDWKIEIRKGTLSKDDYKFGDPQADREWEEVAKNFDIVWFSYMENAIAYCYLEVLSKKYGLKFVIDYDDNMLRPCLSNPYFATVFEEPGLYEKIKIILKEAPYLVVTNNYLKKEYADFRGSDKGIFVFPNYDNFELSQPGEHIEDDVLTIGWQGGWTHYDDFFKSSFYEAIKYILYRHKNVRFSVVGFAMTSPLDKLPRFERIDGKGDYYEWMDMWRQWIRKIDIGVCPLEDNLFNLGKSPIKTYSFWSAKLPVVVSDVGPYKIVNEKTGIRVKTGGEWVSALEDLIKNEEKRRKMGEEGYKFWKENCLIENHWQELKEIVEKIYYDKR